ncbi:type I restriction enzyme S subunit [Pullulanibacillus pueri]|uniref:Type I restriction modification DNA specificity domain-containing protein n=1 Tax=Pullulanibacillus pueri TaxID=1437324 RepID=A0A8J2ZR35_9BACL|nr:restriction endonuclease subunit S [Pullulanibacillus pueri]MBM7679880.1 type I restriction enzyme S subunit [Pullulanibacillus pueri]GGH73293.1 hypothetical protein GCM10007096_00390 [Pullulanibacillus pueri]
MVSSVLNWEEVQLKDISELKYGKSPKDIKVQSSDFPIYGTSGLNGYARKPLFNGPLILIGRKGTIDKPLYIKEDCWIIDTAFGLFHNKEKVDLKWLYYFLDHYKLERLNEATGVPSLSKTNLNTISISLPTKNEQHKIAAILSSVDDAIEKTEAIIEQTEKVKKGLMQQLLTKGIGHTKFKKTEMGEIPVEWELKKLEQIVDILDGQRRPIKKADRDLIDGDIPYYGASGIIDWVNDFIFNEPLILVAEDGENLRSRSLPVAFRIEGKTWVNNHAHILRPSNININFLEIYLESINYESYITGSAQPKLNQKSLRNILIAYPSIKEQQKIASVIMSFTSKISLESKKLERLKEMKRGLMQVLLTGKVRVKVNESEVTNT